MHHIKKTITSSILAFLLCLTHHLYADMSVENGDIGSDYKSLNFDLKIIGISSAHLTEELKNNNVRSLLEEDFLRIFLYKLDQNKHISKKVDEQIKDVSNADDRFFWEISEGDIKIEQNENTTYTIYMTNISIQPNPDSNRYNEVETGKYLNAYKETGEGVTTEKWRLKIILNKLESTNYIANKTDDNLYVEKINAVPAVEPANFSAKAQYRAIELNWDAPKSPVRYTRSSISRVPSKVLTIAFSDTTNTDTPWIKAKVVDLQNPEAEYTDTTCKFLGHNKENCIQCDEEEADKKGVFIEASQEAGPQGEYFFTEASSSLGKYSKLGLDLDKDYTVVMQYSKGIKRTKCITLRAEDNLSLAEINGEADATLGDPRCFIVSAAYGSTFSKHVDIFRWMRDSILAKSAIGEAFIEFYYDNSKPLADAIYKSQSLQTITKIFLWPIAMILYAVQIIFISPFYSLCLLSLLSGMLYFFMIYRSRKRQ